MGFHAKIYAFFGKMSSNGTGGGVDDAAPVQIAAGQTQYQHFRRCDVAGEGDVVLVAQAGDIGDLAGHLFVVGVVEEEDEIEFVVGNAGTDLLAAALIIVS